VRISNSFHPDEIAVANQINRMIMTHKDFAVVRRAPGFPGLARKFLAMQGRVDDGEQPKKESEAAE
jgi:hypothetical protein